MRRLRQPLSRLGGLPLYLGAAAGYIGLGVFFNHILFSWVEGAAFLLAAVWVVPALIRALGRARR